MNKAYSKALETTTKIERLLWKIDNSHNAPVIIFIGGIHGNEPAGVFALQNAKEKLKPQTEKIKGAVYAFSGNLKGLSKNQRYVDKDLNRLWTKESLQNILAKKEEEELVSEEKELIELYHQIKSILDTHTGPFYFVDFHTTSSKTLPFITINDALINRKFSRQIPVPVVLGIEEYLEGPLLSYINSLGYVSLGFESGQHDEVAAIENSEAFIFLTLVFAGCMKEEDIPNIKKYYERLKIASEGKAVPFEVIYRYLIKPHELFKMKEGFKSFQPIKKRTLLAISNNEPVQAKQKGELFMPLYQQKGKDGFFIIKRIPSFFLWLSALLRDIKADYILALLPGISWESPKREALIVNIKIARFLTKQIFHLLGYRNKQINDTYVRMNNRERVAKKKMYHQTSWFKKS
ncbi:succinylglutamate desuccinylase/aspartoacylase family protein [Leptobacterium sp. I13]|uniref:succinylglutamate desuccinylase/aspartoacylase domain-containing protein n=1 Tax=Leptobacterium meishanense TaxID=3128904 RepID=UPI0030EB8B9D